MRLEQTALHKIPDDVAKAIMSNAAVVKVWNDITPLARNEWVCFITSAKKEETRQGRVARLLNDLQHGKRRPCCWAGCIHR